MGVRGEVRQLDKFVGGRIEGAVNIPQRELGQALDQLPTDEPFVVVCGSGHCSTIGMVALQMAGFEEVKSLAGGTNAWTAAELPVVME